MEKKLQVSTSLITCILYLCFISLGSNYSSFDGAKIRFIVKILFFIFLIIFGYNKKEDVEKSVEWIEEVLEVEPEVFDYYALPHTVKEPDRLHDDDEEG